MKKVYLVCNAHLDPVWLWEWEEGAAEAVSTFRIAADFCEQYDGFVFNHNEALLYRWIAEYEPALFKRIQGLVADGRWHIMGGWYLQPDCNMPSGESFVRQILSGRRYFLEQFGQVPTVAINFDPFGHNRGLVQIMQQAGYTGYIVTRPGQQDCPLPADDFVWEGFAGSRIAVHRGFSGYNSQRGEAVKKLTAYCEAFPEQETGLLLWGIGNHGGGPSREDIAALQAHAAQHPEVEWIHATPEAYFADRFSDMDAMPRFAQALNPWGVGCYTSQIRIKQQHRKLENELFLTEKMLAAAVLHGLLPAPSADLSEAVDDLLLSQFHDILPGSSIPAVEETSLRLLAHGQEVVSRKRMQAFVSLLSGQPVAEEGEIPIFVYNPHPYPVKGVFECEFQLADQNWTESFSLAEIFQEGRLLPSQTEQEASNINLDWRKRAVFGAELAPSSMNRFGCRFRKVPARPVLAAVSPMEPIRLDNGEMVVVINTQTGLVDSLCVAGKETVRPGAFGAVVMLDDDDPWGMRVRSFRQEAGRFTLMDAAAGSRFSGLEDKAVHSVRVIEEGPVRTVVEAVFQYGDSFLCQRYLVPKAGCELGLEVRVFWNEKRRFLKLAVPTALGHADFLGQVAYGRDRMPVNGEEAVAQKWVALVSEDGETAFTCINDGTYGCDCLDGELRLSLLRSPGYSSHPIHDRPMMPQDRFSPHIDQGERFFRFWFQAGTAADRMACVDREAHIHNEKPFALSYYPHGGGATLPPAILLDSQTVQLTAFKRAEDGDGFILRLHASADKAGLVRLRVPALGLDERVEVPGEAIRTYRLRTDAASLVETDVCEGLTPLR
jgi:alpha-mannosidase